VDGGKQPRGEGFELRTDSYGAIRAGKGIFITADAQICAYMSETKSKNKYDQDAY